MKAGEVSVEVAIRSLRDDVFFMPGDMIVADWPARVGRINFEKEDFVPSGTEILSLTEPTFKVALFASPSDRAKLEIGQKVTIEMDAGDQESDGVISQLDDVVTRNGASELYEGEVEALKDLVAVEGMLIRSRTGELKVEATDVRLLVKCLQPRPEKWHGLTDVEKIL